MLLLFVEKGREAMILLKEGGPILSAFGYLEGIWLRLIGGLLFIKGFVINLLVFYW